MQKIGSTGKFVGDKFLERL